MRKKLLMIIGALLLLCSLPLSGTFATSTKHFSDVPPSKHFAEAVYDLAERNIIGGYPDGTFKPGNSITRGQAAAIIAKLIKLDTSKLKDPGFKDVPKANGYYKAIAAMAEKSIISGYGDGRFGPNDPITRAQMASILVKAFDLPRYNFNSYKSPFEDVHRGVGHDPNILTIYRLGITTGTSPDRFSPNTSITRGQAAKMMKATEEAKSQIVTVKASDFGWDQFKMYDSNHKDTGIYQAVEGKNKPTGGVTDRIHLVPLKEGDGTFKAALVYSGNPDKKFYRKYYVHVKEVNGKLKLKLERTEDFLPSPVAIGVENKGPVQNISLSTMDGKKITDNMKFTKCLSFSPSDCVDNDETDSEGKYRNVHIVIDQPGRYIATIRFEDGKEVRYGLEAVSSAPSFKFSFKVLEERPNASLDLGANYDIGKHILPKGSEQIAEITRDEGTNMFHVVGKKAGAVEIKLPDHKKLDLMGLHVRVQEMGPIIQVEIYELMDTHM
ncbi:S-layer homology domain-containing protein [Sporosarcina newyorkensis]|uniref:S-layer homology domain-containing protein n=1 Tax=Sporosarcina newyorkensis TaxID=759851 RepID=A0A1T4YJR3_9BACL|nr:S-layer homology domain-containing protein [Sporosarcina newyorkensis]SKB01515.1 S-layer homology domain-containing protein [Sporosarcina newyorkensis]